MAKNDEEAIAMANIIAMVWDFDKTLIDGYMEDPIFEEYGVDGRAFWREAGALPEKYREEQGVKVNPDTIYLNQMIRYAKDGRFAGLSNEKLRGYGQKLKFYPGVPGIFARTRTLIEENPDYQDVDIRVEHYIISTGLTEIIKGTPIMADVAGVWGCEFIEAADAGGAPVISEIAYTIDNTTKTRALFEINKGVGKVSGVDVNTKLPETLRRVHFKNMIYIADGPSDIPAFSVVNQNGGATFAVYPKGDAAALHQVEQMRMDGRIQMFAAADYSEGETADMWLCDKITAFAERIRAEEAARIAKAAGSAPRHLD
ncbi:hypothetical protein HMP0721_1242 [Pseudoramibacter alactolyticus ATCC 23263]|jgi:hypothetical protein|uniref:Haloacid dehalogenase-like hydrolase n=2 Tax=Pseudoramibacter TaxID=113286 RepID=E6MGV9_9FIRM|nr:hypothetical protein HMP0721_1242 [Pseudoramibacter alactolyticus ATCC 23263]